MVLSSLERDVERCSLCADGAGCAALDGWSRENAAGVMCSEVSALQGAAAHGQWALRRRPDPEDGGPVSLQSEFAAESSGVNSAADEAERAQPLIVASGACM